MTAGSSPIVINYKRPEAVSRYTKQQQFIDAPERYTIIEATTKAGKTTGCIVWLFEQALAPLAGRPDKDGTNYWWVAPVYSQAKIAYRRMKRYIKPKELYVSNEGELTITLANGAVLWFKSAENPDNLYGEDVHAMVLDEASRMKEAAWFACRSTLTATNGKCKIIGNVKGTQNWAYTMARKAEEGQLPDWAYYKITAKDAVEAGVMKPEELADAERTLPRDIFLELYYGIPFVNKGNKFAFCFDRKKHVASCKHDPGQYTYLSFDFNRNPICCTVIQWYDDTVYVLECIKLSNSNIYQLCDALLVKYPDAHFIVCGDSTGLNKSAITQDDISYYDIIQARLGLGGSQMQYVKNPTIKDNQVLVNAVLEHYRVLIDPDGAQAVIFDLENVEVLPDGSIRKGDRNDPAQQADALDTFRYWVNRWLAGFVKLY